MPTDTSFDKEKRELGRRALDLLNSHGIALTNASGRLAFGNDPKDIEEYAIQMKKRDAAKKLHDFLLTDLDVMPKKAAADALTKLNGIMDKIKETGAFAVSTFGKSDTEKLWLDAIALYTKIAAAEKKWDEDWDMADAPTSPRDAAPPSSPRSDATKGVAAAAASATPATPNVAGALAAAARTAPPEELRHETGSGTRRHAASTEEPAEELRQIERPKPS